MRIVLALTLSLLLLVPSAQAQFLSDGQPTITLSTVGMSGTAMNIAWSPVFNQYYGAGGGSPGSSGRVWDSAGTILQTLTPINEDYRSVYFNPNTNQLEMTTFGANGGGFANPDRGILKPNLDGSGFYQGTYTILLASAPGLISEQSVPAYDAARNLFYSYDRNISASTVNLVNRTTGALSSSIVLDLAAAGNPLLAIESIGYDPSTDSIISFTSSGGNRALAFNSQTGAFKASINLPGFSFADTSYSVGFANNQIFVHDGEADLYRGFTITAAVPEPATIAAFGMAATVTGCVMFRRRRKRRLKSKNI